MEVKSNLVAEERQETLKRFSPAFKKVARVVMGEPTEPFKRNQQEKVMLSRQAKINEEFKAAKAEKMRKKLIESRLKKKAQEQEAGGKAMDVDKEGESKDEDNSEPAKAELTSEEKNTLWFAPKPVKDLKETVLNQNFAKFSIPSKSEGFDEIAFEWQKEEPSKAYLRKWVVEKKKTTKMETLVPSAWFHDTYKTWQTTFAEWQAAHAAFRGSEAGRKDAESKRKIDQGLEERADEGDIFSVANVCDVNRGIPLFKDFGNEDWALLQLRYELFLLRAAFEKDANDPDRPGIPEAHIGFYFHKYFKKAFNVKLYGVDTVASLIDLVKDTISLDDGLLSSPVKYQAEEFSNFVKHTEENRRERQRRIDAGDETSRLKINPIVVPKKVSPGLKSKQLR